MKVVALGGGVDRAVGVVTEADAVRADIARGDSAVVEQVIDHQRGRRFALCSRNADDRHLVGRMIEKGRGELGKCHARVGRDDGEAILSEPLDGVLDNENTTALGIGAVVEIVTVADRPRNADEHRGGRCLSRITAERDDLGRLGIDSRTVDDLGVGKRLHQFFE